MRNRSFACQPARRCSRPSPRCLHFATDAGGRWRPGGAYHRRASAWFHRRRSAGIPRHSLRSGHRTSTLPCRRCRRSPGAASSIRANSARPARRAGPRPTSPKTACSSTWSRRSPGRRARGRSSSTSTAARIRAARDRARCTTARPCAAAATWSSSRVNHRLNLFGYLYLPGFPDSGNAGMLDLVLALRWVRDNIAAFGGDPACVTLLGQSGGGAKIATLMAMPRSRRPVSPRRHDERPAAHGLGAVARGGAYPGVAGQARPAAAASRGAGDDARQGPAARAFGTVDPYIGRGACYMGPVLDERTLTRHPFYPDAPPQSAGIPMMIGNTHDETRSLIGRGDPRQRGR